MKELIFIVCATIGCLLIHIVRVHKQLTIIETCYYNCLLALSEYDPDLKEYLEKENKLK